ncbi:MAG TPA: hypothetical protein VGM90_17560 [Kofleriaceae bacterium]|jgi:hypothetical protein
MLRVALLSTLICGCGRISFDPGTGGGSSGDDGSIPKDTPDRSDSNGDAPPAVCGDDTCNGTETCKSCVGDCRTASNVCGNGECGAGEDSANCFLDCGPTPRPWDADEADLLARINTLRATGITCPMGTVYPAEGGFTLDAAANKAARDWAWERAHLSTTGFTPCNLADWNTIAQINGPTDNTARMTNITTNDANCNQVMNPASQTIGIGIASDVKDTLVLLYN